MKALLAPIAAGLAITLSACGSGDAADAVVLPDAASPARSTPPAAAAAGTLVRIADADAGHTRIGYVNTKALAAFGGPLSASSVAQAVLGSGAARLASATGSPATAVQVGDGTVFDGTTRSVGGGSAALRAKLSATTPDVSLITDETPSAVQSCLADGPAEVIVGSAVLGRSAAIGVGLLDSQDPPAGRKLLICVAPHFVRQLDPTLARLRKQFADPALPATQRPKIGEADIGERDIVTAAISLDTIPASTLRDLLSGGRALTSLIGD